MNDIEQLKLDIQKTPNDPALYYDLGGLYLSALQLDEAMVSYNQALKLAPHHPQILLQLGNTAFAANRYTLASDYFTQCLKINANHAAAQYNLGNAFRELGQLQEAITCFQKTLTLTPSDADAHNNLGNVYRELGELDKAVVCYETALKYNPQLFHALTHLIHQKQHMCNWDGLNQQIVELRKILKTKPEAQIAPFAFLAMPNTTAEEQLLCASQWATQQFSPMKAISDQLSFSFKRESHTKIKIAYLSADFRLHPLAFLITDLLENHDREKFEIYAYSYGPNDASEARQRIIQAVDKFIDIQALSDIESARHIHHHEIDILIDLTGYTKSSRTSIVALKPAPLTINWLGYPGTMGKLHQESLFDYIIVDEVIAPEQNHFSEQCITIQCYQPNNNVRPLGEIRAKADHNLPDDAFVFCCFNQTFKISAEVFAAWMHILQQVPHSVLWLLECNPWARENLIKKAQQAGIAAERIIFAARTNIADHLARHRHADLFLDTTPYGAHTTASDALWMGLPIITCIGDTFPSRVAASLLTTLEANDLITNTLKEYEKIAISLAKNQNKLQALRLHLSKHHAKLFDNKEYVKVLESKYNKIYYDYHNKHDTNQ
jgi:protein O-GlcNAc transferase